MTDLDHKIKDIIASSFHVDVTEITDATTSEDVEGWDSLAHGTLILRIQRILNIRFDPRAANAVKNVGELIALAGKARRG